METVFLVKIEFFGVTWHRDDLINVFKERERAEAYLKEAFDDARYDVQEKCDKIDWKFDKPDSFEVTGDNHMYWVSGCVEEKPVE